MLAGVCLPPFLSQLNAGCNDEGMLAIGATRVLAGECPYRDFLTRTTPGTYDLLALVYFVLGPNMLATRALVWLVAVMLAGLLYLTAARFLPPRWAFVPVVLFCTTGVSHFPVLNHHWLSVTAYALGVFLLQVWWEQPDARHSAAVGASVALAWWLLQSEGAALALVALTCWACRRPLDARTARAALAGWVGAALLLWAPVLIRVSPLRIFDASVVDVLRYHVGFNDSPYSWQPLYAGAAQLARGLRGFAFAPAQLDWLAHALSFWLVWVIKHGCFYLVLILAALSCKRAPVSVRICALSLAVLAIVNHGRQDMLYVNYMTPWLYALLVWLIFKFLPRPAAIAGAVVLLFTVQLVYSLEDAAAYRFPVSTFRGTLYVDQPAVAVAWNQTLREVARLTPPGTPAVFFPYATALGFYSATRCLMPDPLTFPLHSPEKDFQALLAVVRSQRPAVIYDVPIAPQALDDYPTVNKGEFFAVLARWNAQLLDGYELKGPLPQTQVYVRK